MGSAADEEVHGDTDQRREQHHQQQDDGFCQQEGPDCFDDALHVDLTGTAGNVQYGATGGVSRPMTVTMMNTTPK